LALAEAGVAAAALDFGFEIDRVNGAAARPAAAGAVAEADADTGAGRGAEEALEGASAAAGVGFAPSGSTAAVVEALGLGGSAIAPLAGEWVDDAGSC
jgi:hypothetical protein